MPLTKLKAFLDRNEIKYETILHPLAYTAQGVAAIAHIPGKELAKTVIVNVDGILAMAVLPASTHVDTGWLKSAIGAREVKVATEQEFKDAFPDCEVGAMPPFGNLYNMTVYVDQSLTKDVEIAFNAGSHRDLIRLAYADFVRLVNPVVLSFARERAARTGGWAWAER